MSKSLKKLIDINRLREFKNKLVGAGSAYVQTSAVDQTIAGTKTFSKPIVGSVTGSSGSCTGNAATATKATQDSDGKQINTTYSKVGHTHDDRYYTEAEVNNLLKGKANTSGTYSNLTVGNASTAATAATATNATYANWLRTSSHSDHLFHTEWDNAGYFWTYVTAGNGDYRAVRVARSDSAATAQACTGNAATATKATQDSDGNQINTTYSKNGHTHDDRYYTETEVNNLLKGKANTSHTHNFVETPDNNHAISFDWGSQVPGFVGLTVDVTKQGGIVTTATAASAIRAQWYAAYPDGAEAHNAMWGGRDITAAFNNGTVSANIANGTFKDIFPGDYITKSVTISGTTYNVNWVIADCDYWINKGDQGNGMETHHVVIVPQALILKTRMNSANTTEGGYAGSEMYKKIIPACTTGIVSAFGSSHILTFRDHLTRDLNTSAVSSGITVFTGAPNWNGAWYSQQCNLMSEAMVYDGPHCASSALDNIMAIRQMSAFRLSEKLINYNRQAWWLRDVVSSAHFAAVGVGGATTFHASLVRGVRPFALLR